MVSAGPRKKPKEPAVPPVPIETPPPPAKAAPAPPLFPGPLPVDPGGVPKGLANLSAQGCNACHFQAHDEWEGSAHANGWASTAFREAVEAAGTPACTVCHQPLAAQHSDLVTYDAGDINRPLLSPNPRFDATLATEGVTCATCHVRDGQIVGSHDVKAPHATVRTDELRSAKLCATCHQLTWPGADQPFYDTFGEWERSPQAKAGIVCQDCHMGAGAGARVGTDHAVANDPARAVSVLVDLDSVRLTRGSPAVDLAITLQNTGAGHSFPTGTPYRGVRLEAALVGPVGKKGEMGPWPSATFTADLARKLAAEAPWATLADTRIPAGGEARFDWKVALPHEAPAGDWSLRVTLIETVSGKPSGEPFVVRTLPLTVD